MCRMAEEGRDLLMKLKKKGSYSQQEMARALGCPRATLASWLIGRRKPGRKWAERLRAQYGIPVDSW